MGLECRGRQCLSAQDRTSIFSHHHCLAWRACIAGMPDDTGLSASKIKLVIFPIRSQVVDPWSFSRHLILWYLPWQQKWAPITKYSTVNYQRWQSSFPVSILCSLSWMLSNFQWTFDHFVLLNAMPWRPMWYSVMHLIYKQSNAIGGCIREQSLWLTAQLARLSPT